MHVPSVIQPPGMQQATQTSSWVLNSTAHSLKARYSRR